ncbi:chorismate synthase [bacterium]|nr:chorismate synthase [bacterium]
MNSFGRNFRVSVLGESHGELVGILIDGCPPGIPLSVDDFMPDLERRQAKGVKGTTPRKEQDIPLIRSGFFQGKTTGAPLLIEFKNENVKSQDYDKIKNTPRPGHADFVAYKKFGGFNDFRGSGHFSGRLTAGIVAAGVVAKKLLKPIKIEARVIEVFGKKDIDQAIDQALNEGDSVGGIVECRVSGLSVGLGEPFFDSVESLLAHAIFAIPATKGIEFGAGFACAKMKGSAFGDEITDASGHTSTNHSGGINGGITNGNELIFRVAVKPTSSIKKEKNTIDMQSGDKTTISVQGRHDACIALRVPVVVEAMTAIVLADLASQLN